MSVAAAQQQTRVVMFDVDGVIIQGPSWSRNVRADCGIEPAALQDFFRADFGRCLLGEADLKVAIAPWLARWGSAHSADAFLSYWFSLDAAVDPLVLNTARRLARLPGVACVLATNQEAHRARYLMAENGAGLGTHFSAIHAACDLGAAKPDPRFFSRLLAKVREAHGDNAALFFVDDTEANVLEARRHGILAHMFVSAPAFKAWLAEQGFDL